VAAAAPIASLGAGAWPTFTAALFLEHEARALLTRLDRVQPFALRNTMVPAASLVPISQIAIERYLIRGRRRLREQVRSYIRWLRAAARLATPIEMQRRFTVLRLRFNTVLSQLDLFEEAITQRSEQEIGVWLSGLDVAAQDALELPLRFFDPPPIACFLHRGMGGAIRRARTRLPGGGENPVALVRIPRERMIGYGIASSLVHEVGHQAAALLGLVESLRAELQRTRLRCPVSERPAWRLYERWISEIVADFWAVAKVGISSTLGLIGIVSLPRWFIFRLNLDDPHPFPFFRVLLSCAMGSALYPHRQWGALASVFESFYPPVDLGAARSGIIALLRATLPRFIALLTNHRPQSLRGASLREVVASVDRGPDRLLAWYERWRVAPNTMKSAPPTLIFAVFGRARVTGKLSPEQENRWLGKLITYWALRSTLDIADVCATVQASPRQRSLLFDGKSKG
jgi:hypothetical protein